MSPLGLKCPRRSPRRPRRAQRTARAVTPARRGTWTGSSCGCDAARSGGRRARAACETGAARPRPSLSGCGLAVQGQGQSRKQASASASSRSGAWSECGTASPGRLGRRPGSPCPLSCVILGVWGGPFWLLFWTFWLTFLCLYSSFCCFGVETGGSWGRRSEWRDKTTKEGEQDQGQERCRPASALLSTQAFTKTTKPPSQLARHKERANSAAIT